MIHKEYSSERVDVHGFEKPQIRVCDFKQWPLPQDIDRFSLKAGQALGVRQWIKAGYQVWLLSLIDTNLHEALAQ